MSAPEIELRCIELEKKYLSKTIFRGINLILSNSSSLSITGKNGSGKSTLLKIISHLIRQSGGKIEIKINGKLIEKENIFKYTGMLAPYINLYDELTASENLHFFCKLKSTSSNNISEKEIKERINFLLEKVNLYKRRNDLIRDFSSGMKQRVKLAFAVINEPPLLLLDEPRTNLDTEGIDVVYEYADLQKKNGILIVATNEPQDTSLCEQTINIENYKKILTS
jgi:heme exporter protein A